MTQLLILNNLNTTAIENTYFSTAIFSFAAVPSAPRSVISSVNETSLVLEWSEPRDQGGREDLLYNVICKKCLPERGTCTRCDDNVDISPRHLGLTERHVTVRNLQAHTQYSFEIQAVNGVSNKSPYAPQFASVNITTNQAGESVISLDFKLVINMCP